MAAERNKKDVAILEVLLAAGGPLSPTDIGLRIAPGLGYEVPGHDCVAAIGSSPKRTGSTASSWVNANLKRLVSGGEVERLPRGLYCIRPK